MSTFAHKKIISLRHIEGKDYGTFITEKNGKPEEIPFNNIQITTLDETNPEWVGGLYETVKIPWDLLQQTCPGVRNASLGSLIGKYLYTFCSFTNKRTKDGGVYQAAQINGVLVSEVPLPIATVMPTVDAETGEVFSDIPT